MNTSVRPREMHGVDGCHPYDQLTTLELAEENRRAKIRAAFITLDWAIAIVGVCGFFTLLAWIV